MNQTNINSFRKDTQGRDWTFTVNNPKLTEQEMYNYLSSLTNVKYFVFVREKGDGTPQNLSGTEHHQGYIEFATPRKFSTIKNFFSSENIGVDAFISQRQYARASCVNYVKKTGKFEYKAHTRIGEMFEYGEFSQSGSANVIKEMIELKKQGAAVTEIYESHPYEYARYNKFVNKMALEYKAEHYKKNRRQLQVTYIYGSAGVGKTRYVMDKYGDENVFRLTDYGNYNNGKPNFDGYNGQDVIVLEEYRSSIKFSILMSMLDVYHFDLPARYHDKVACYTKVYILSNLPIQKQHEKLLTQDLQSWQAFLRRIHKIYDFDKNKELCIMDYTFSISGTSESTNSYRIVYDLISKYSISATSKKKNKRNEELPF